ncbi:MAG: DUF1850 domain-containing protein [Bacillota bacterium]
MSNKQRKRSAFILVLFSFIVVLSLPVSLTKVSYPDQTYYFKEKEFSIQWIHSVEKEAWREFYQRDKNDLLLTHTKFKTFGAGVPAQGTILKKQKGYITYQVDRRMNEVNLIVSQNVKSTLYINNKEIPLFAQVNDYEEVIITPTKRPYWMIWL